MASRIHILNRILPAGLRSILRWLALSSIPSLRHLDMPRRMAHLKSLGFAPRVILDVGSATGDWARLAAGIWPDARVVGFEPTRADEPALRRASADLPNFTFHRCFLGAERKRVQFIAAGDGTTALGATAADLGQTLPVKTDAEVNEAEILLLDDLVSSGAVPQPDLIKIDVQGFELEVLRGARQALAGCQGVLVEVNLMRFASEMPTADEVIDFLRQHGFAWYDIAGALRRPLDDALGQMDLIFLRADHPLRSSTRWT
jgi:FkbM family methyltransferase